MKFVIFGLSISSSWGNGHATLWRGLCGALARRGHEVIFFERDQPYYAPHRDYWEVQGGELVLYDDWRQVLPLASSHLSDADVGMVTSYCADGAAASDLVLESKARIRSFYDLDAPITLSRINAGMRVDYIPTQGLRDFDLVLSYTGGRTLDELRTKLGARRVAPLYGSVDPSTHYPAQPKACYQADLSYMGTYSPDRDAALRVLFIKAARRLPLSKFLIGGSKYDGSFPWQDNVYFVDHVPASEHSAFYCSSRLTLNVTRQPMAEMGFCPSGRFFEATACGATATT